MNNDEDIEEINNSDSTEEDSDPEFELITDGKDFGNATSVGIGGSGSGEPIDDSSVDDIEEVGGEDGDLDADDEGYTTSPEVKIIVKRVWKEFVQIAKPLEHPIERYRLLPLKRTISNICENSLLFAFLQQLQRFRGTTS